MYKEIIDLLVNYYTGQQHRVLNKEIIDLFQTIHISIQQIVLTTSWQEIIDLAHTIHRSVQQIVYTGQHRVLNKEIIDLAHTIHKSVQQIVLHWTTSCS